MHFNTFYNRFINEEINSVVLSTTALADGDFKYKIDFSADSIENLVKLAEDDANLLEFLYSEFGVNDTVVTLEDNTFVGIDLNKHLKDRIMQENVDLNEKSFKMVQFMSDGKLQELPFSAYAHDEVEAASKVIDDKIAHGLIPRGYKILKIDGKAVTEAEEVTIPAAEEVKYTLFVVTDKENKAIWAKAVPDGQTLRINSRGSGITNDALDSRIKALNIGVTSL